MSASEEKNAQDGLYGVFRARLGNKRGGAPRISRAGNPVRVAAKKKGQPGTLSHLAEPIMQSTFQSGKRNRQYLTWKNLVCLPASENFFRSVHGRTSVSSVRLVLIHKNSTTTPYGRPERRRSPIHVCLIPSTFVYDKSSSRGGRTCGKLPKQTTRTQDAVNKTAPPGQLAKKNETVDNLLITCG